MRTSRVLTVLGTAVVAVAALAGTATAATERGAGFVWANQPTTAAYTPAANYQMNSTELWGVENTITRTGLGTYAVRFTDLGVVGGTALVTAYGSGTQQCKVTGWGPSGADQVVYVRCHTLAGAAVDTTFTASYTNRNHWAGYDYNIEYRGAYLWADQPTAGSYTPSPTYQFNSSDATNTVNRTGVGAYTAHLPGLSTSGGHVQVTAYGSGTERCKSAGWGPSGSAQQVQVRCFTAAGAPVDTRFTMTFTDRTNILGLEVCCNPNGYPSAYAWAHNPTAASYTPATGYQHTGSNSTNATVTRSGTGSYTVGFPHANLANGNVAVTAYGTGPEFCKVAGWGSGGINVRCFGAGGSPADTLYNVAFTGLWVLG